MPTSFLTLAPEASLPCHMIACSQIRERKAVHGLRHATKNNWYKCWLPFGNIHWCRRMLGSPKKCSSLLVTSAKVWRISVLYTLHLQCAHP
jgi:hypothetical protein